MAVIDRASAAAASPKSMAEDAYERLEELIVTMELAPGSIVTEAELCQMLGKGRTPVREAVLRLSAEHLIEVMPRRGLKIPPIDVRKQQRLIETRRVLETLVACTAAKRASRKERESFNVLAKAFRTDGARSYRTFLRIDHRFNKAVAAASDNEFAVGSLESLHGLSRRFWHFYSSHEEDLPTVAELHASVASAISSGDERAVAKAIKAHMDYILGFTRAMLDD
ncbi:MAG: GntR family transcriptional regulator [Hyphomonas sp.]